MSFVKKLKEYEKRFAWSLSGFVLAAILGAVSVYQGFFKEVSPDLNFVVTSNSSVLDVKENLGDLDIVYEGESLKSRGKDLRVITFEVVNQGNDAILPNYYDPKEPVGFKVVDGVIADEPTILAASSGYLSESLVINRSGNDRATFSNVILEPGDLYQVKVLVLHDVGQDPHIEPIGKVANVSRIEVSTGYSDGNEKSFLATTFGGGWAANSTRFTVYGIAFLFSLFFAIGAGEAISSFFKRKRRRERVEVFKQYNRDSVVLSDEVYFEKYIKGDRSGAINRMYEMLGDEEYLRFVAKALDDSKKGVWESYPSLRGSLKRPLDYFCLQLLEESGIVSFKDEGFLVNKERARIFEEFFKFLKRDDSGFDNHSLEVALDEVEEEQNAQGVSRVEYDPL